MMSVRDREVVNLPTKYERFCIQKKEMTILAIGIITFVGLCLLPGYKKMTTVINKPTYFFLLAVTAANGLLTLEYFRELTARIFLDKKVWERAEARFSSRA